MADQSLRYPGKYHEYVAVARLKSSLPLHLYSVKTFTVILGSNDFVRLFSTRRKTLSIMHTGIFDQSLFSILSMLAKLGLGRLYFHELRELFHKHGLRLGAFLMVTAEWISKYL